MVEAVLAPDVFKVGVETVGGAKENGLIGCLAPEVRFRVVEDTVGQEEDQVTIMKTIGCVNRIFKGRCMDANSLTRSGRSSSPAK